MKYSIITVCMNAGEDLLYTVSDTLSQSYTDFEIVIKDGGSKDGSIEKLPNDKRIKLIQKKDAGIYDAMNQAIAAADGDYCIFINAGDALYHNDTLQQINSFISKNQADFYYGKSYTESSQTINFGPASMNSFFCYRSTICHQAMVIKTEYMKIRGYNLSFNISADREWMVYAYRILGLKFSRMPIMVSKYKGDGVSSRISYKELQKENKCIHIKYFSLCERIRYSLIYSITFPKLRMVISRSPISKKAYYKIRYFLLGKRL